MTTSPTNSNSNNCSQNGIPDIEDLHRQAVLCKSNTYMDPSTGFTVFTEYAHLKRGTCCGNKCRHCPYGWENVVVGEGVIDDIRKTNHGRTSQGNNDQDDDDDVIAAMSRMPSKVKSGEKEEIAKLLENINQGTYFDNDQTLEFQGAKNEKEKEKSLESFSLPSSSCCTVGTTNSSMSTTSCCSSSSSDTASSNSSSSSNCSSSSSSSRTMENDILTCQPKKEQERQRDTFKNVPYTRSGDMGMSVLLSGERRSKDDEAFESMGTVDELCSTVGVVHAELDYYIMRTEKDGVLDSSREEYVELQRQLVEVMCHLFDIGSHLAKPRKKVNTKCFNDNGEGSTVDHSGGKSSSSPSSSSSFQADGLGNGFHKEHIDVLERWIDDMTDQMPELLSFILPTGSRSSSQLHVARCVCRRAERRVQPLVRDGVCDPNAAKYLNRLSDYLFTAARYCNFLEGREEVQYKRPTRATKQRSCVTVELRDDKKKN